MATSPLGGFADLSAYRAAAAQPQGNTLDNLIREISGSIQLQQLPGQLQDQALAKQLQNALLSQKLQDLQNPQAGVDRAIMQQFQQQLATASLNPATGIRRAGTGEAPTGAIQPIYDPVNGAETPYIRDVEMARGVQAQTLADKLALANARLPAGTQGQFVYDANDQLAFVAKPTTVGAAPIVTPAITATGEGFTARPTRASAKGGAKGGMTENQKASLLLKYGQVRDLVGDLEDPKFLDENGVLDTSKLAIEVGNAERSQKIADLNTKENNLSPTLKKEAAGYISSQKDLENLKSKLLQLDASGETPGTFQNAFAVMANNPSEGFFSSLTRQFANSQLTESTKQKEAARSGLESAVTKALSGSAVTPSEAQRLTGLLPKADDDIKTLTVKLAGLEEFLNNKISGLTSAGSLQVGGGVSSPVATPGINPNAPAPIKINSIRLKK